MRSWACRLAVDEINQAGGVMGRPIELISEDSVNPQTAATKAQRMIEQDGAAVLLGEINSASALAIMQVAAAQQARVLEHRRPLRRATRQELQPAFRFTATSRTR